VLINWELDAMNVAGSEPAHAAHVIERHDGKLEPAREGATALLFRLLIR